MERADGTEVVVKSWYWLCSHDGETWIMWGPSSLPPKGLFRIIKQGDAVPLGAEVQ